MYSATLCWFNLVTAEVEGELRHDSMSVLYELLAFVTLPERREDTQMNELRRIKAVLICLSFIKNI